MERYIALIFSLFIFLIANAQPKLLMYKNGTGGGIVQENDLKVNYSNIQNAPVFNYTSNRIWFGTGSAQSNSSSLIWNNSTSQLGIGGNPNYALDVLSTGALRLPVGTSAQTPTMLNGTIRYNTDFDYFEFGRRNTPASLIHSNQIVSLFGASRFPSLNNALTTNMLWTATHRFSVSRHFNGASTDASNSIQVFNNIEDDSDACQVPAGDSVEFRIALNSKNQTMTYPAGRIVVQFYFEPASGGGLPNTISVRMKQGATWGNATLYKKIGATYIYEISEFDYPGDSLSIKAVATPSLGFWLTEIAFHPERHVAYEPTMMLKDRNNSLYYNILGKNYLGNITYRLNPYGDSYFLNNVGIGQQFPTNRLHVSATSDPLRLDGLISNSTATSLLVSSAGIIRTREISTLPVTLQQVINTSGIATGNIALTGSLLATTAQIGTNGEYYLEKNGGENLLQIWNNAYRTRYNGNNRISVTATENELWASSTTLIENTSLSLPTLKLKNDRNETGIYVNHNYSNVTMSNGDYLLSPTQLSQRIAGKRKDYKFGVNFRQIRNIFNDIGCAAGHNETVAITDTTETLYLTTNCTFSGVSNVTITLPSNPQNDVELRVVCKHAFQSIAFQVAGGTSQSIVTTPNSWSTTGVFAEWKIKFYSTTEGSQGGEWTIDKIR